MSIQEDTELSNVSSQCAKECPTLKIESSDRKEPVEESATDEARESMVGLVRDISSSNNLVKSAEKGYDGQISSSSDVHNGKLGILENENDQAVSKDHNSYKQAATSGAGDISEVENFAESQGLSFPAESTKHSSNVSSYTAITAATLNSNMFVENASKQYERAIPKFDKNSHKKPKKEKLKIVIVVTLLVNILVSMMMCAMLGYHLDTNSCRSHAQSRLSPNDSGMTNTSEQIKNGGGDLSCVDDQCEESLNKLNDTLFSYFHSAHQNQELLINILNDPNQLFSRSCATIYASRPSSPSGYYLFRVPNGSFVSLYCDMDRTCGNVTGGWTRLASWDAAGCNGTQCPTNFTQEDYGGTTYCGITPSSHDSICSAAYFSLPVESMKFSIVCGRVTGYIYGRPNTFQVAPHLATIDRAYVDGISFTHGSPGSRSHIWTFAAAGSFSKCPCHNISGVPSFVGSDYFCDAADSSDTAPWQHCSMPSCCQNDSLPWFFKKLPSLTSDPIELRACADDNRADEDVAIKSVEIYVQ